MLSPYDFRVLQGVLTLRIVLVLCETINKPRQNKKPDGFNNIIFHALTSKHNLCFLRHIMNTHFLCLSRL